MLPQGTNPFSPIIPTPPAPAPKKNVTWVVILCIIIALLAGFLGYGIWKWRGNVKENEEKSNIIYGANDPELNPSAKLLAESDIVS